MLNKEKKTIWHGNPSIDSMNDFGKGSMIENVGIKITEIGDDYIKATMPVNEKTIQSYGILHGGASVVLAETLGSYASILCVDFPKYKSVGLDINANHVRSVPKGGMVTATARPLHLGRSTHVWDIQLVDEKERLVCISRLTMAIIEH